MRVVWTAKAKARLREIHDYIAKDSPPDARAVVDRLLARSMILAHPPLIARRVLITRARSCARSSIGRTG